MAFSFPCPGCKLRIEVPDDSAGQQGKCPNCESVFMIPLPEPKAAILPTSAAPPRRPRLETQPRGPLWPWLVGLLGFLIVGSLLFGSCGVLLLYRKAPTQYPFYGGAVVVDGQRILAGRLERQTASLTDGAFHVRTELRHTDPADIDNVARKCKQYKMELRAGRTYVIQMESTQFDCLLRVERFGQVQQQDGRPAMRKAQIVFRPQQTADYDIYATSVFPATGAFTFSVREQMPGQNVGP
jgi:hypothetical protein